MRKADIVVGEDYVKWEGHQYPTRIRRVRILEVGVSTKDGLYRVTPKNRARVHIVNEDGTLMMENVKTEHENPNYDSGINHENYRGYRDRENLRDKDTGAMPWDKTYDTWDPGDEPQVFVVLHSQIRMPWSEHLTEKERTAEARRKQEQWVSDKSVELGKRADAVNASLGYKMVDVHVIYGRNPELFFVMTPNVFVDMIEGGTS